MHQGLSVQHLTIRSAQGRSPTMRDPRRQVITRSKYSEEQIAFALKQAELGASMPTDGTAVYGAP
ncbi:hypothetical protein AW878_01620 [Bordetella pseudohinzii]|uniref:Transposase n=1 Tax=Bordetella pseudohinzii TaxID=1331258 RepID=A0ABN4RNJ3_9BORD|nr:hypothetical protein BBN53_06555 [Bordetella pseudohinzii]KXA82311.1 hypothetical protein AW877_02495 [Bordetella pseudohinzii]KXA82717.1 hypothetical protein AW878_01620 [Bordetella pseudohinzii]